MPQIKVNWLEVSGRRYPVARWTHNGKPVLELVDYAIYLGRERAQSALTVETAVYNIVVLLNFCCRESVELVELDDLRLREFRDFELVRLRDRVGRKGSEKVQCRTVNSRLRSVYNFMLWFQNCYSMGTNIIGPAGCNIRSTLTEHHIYGGRKAVQRLLYPLLLPLTGSSSKHRPMKAVTDDMKSSMLNVLNTVENDYIASRDILIINIADALGMRRASINSLTCSQFLDGVKDSESLEDLVLVPSSQKFGYQWPYTFPFQLVSQILQFIDGPRNALLRKLKVPPSLSEDRLFLSSTSGRPLTNRALTTTIAAYMRSSGLAKGSIHRFRHKFVNEEVEREILRRVSLGLDTSIESVAAAVALKVGQANPGSLHTYISDAFSRIEKKLPQDNASKIRYLEQEIKKMTSQLKVLKNLETVR